MRVLPMLCLLVLCPVIARAQAAGTQTAIVAKPRTPETSEREAARSAPVRVVKFTEPPTIDGRLEEKAWRQAAVLKDFYQVQPGDNISPSQPTEVLLGYDEKFLYLAFRAYDEAGQVRATVAKRDAVFEDDTVSVLLDTYNDKRKAYILTFNPLGVQADGILTEGRDDDYSVDLLMDSKGVISDDGYTVEVAIPFKSLRYEAGKDKLWGIHVFRHIKRYNDELDSWMPLSRSKSGQLNQEGHLAGLEGLSSERALEIIPTLTVSETGQRKRTIAPAALAADPLLADPGRFVNQPLETSPGVTVKLGITPTITLDFALKPDFAEVEADQTVIEANQRFPIFFPEKRPFFLEGIDIFQTPLQAVHTRAIIAPDAAVKLTGKSGPNTFGLLLASDNAPGNFSDEERADPRNIRFVDKNAYVGVLRLKRDIGKESNLGLIATGYSFIDQHNYTGGFDGRFRLDRQTTLDFQVLGTTSRRFFRDATLGRSIYRTGNGLGYNLRYNNAGRNFTYRFTGQGRTRDYRADVGFTRRTNNNTEEFFFRYGSNPQPKARLASWNVTNSSTIKFNWQGQMQNWFQFPQLTFKLRRQTFLTLGAYAGYERVFEEEFGAKRTAARRGAFAGADNERQSYYRGVEVSAGTTPSKKYSGSFLIGYNHGAFDFDLGSAPHYPRVSPAALANPGAALDPGPGNELYGSLTLNYQPTSTLRASLDYTKDRLTRHDTGRVAFDENIFTLRTTYQFSRFTFVRARIDYETLAANIRGEFLLGWTPHPGTSFYVGYNDDRNYNGYSPFTDQNEPGLRRNERRFFLKMSYLFRRGF